MMERLVTVKDVSERYGCSMQTARKYIRQMMPHMESPLSATVTAFREWEEKRTVCPVSTRHTEQILKDQERVIVPRKR